MIDCVIARLFIRASACFHAVQAISSLSRRALLGGVIVGTHPPSRHTFRRTKTLCGFARYCPQHDLLGVSPNSPDFSTMPRMMTAGAKHLAVFRVKTLFWKLRKRMHVVNVQGYFVSAARADCALHRAALLALVFTKRECGKFPFFISPAPA